mmetsp:Transcript_44685/g.136335  ORF Transcript_44685/g.136335 Transcript_44685/m.136335 type:complete len:115 (+) Transcript_44685:1687-2031(+)
MPPLPSHSWRRCVRQVRIFPIGLRLCLNVEVEVGKKMGAKRKSSVAWMCVMRLLGNKGRVRGRAEWFLVVRDVVTVEEVAAGVGVVAGDAVKEEAESRLRVSDKNNCNWETGDT